MILLQVQLANDLLRAGRLAPWRWRQGSPACSACRSAISANITGRRDQHLGGDPPSDPLLHGLGQYDRIVSGIVKRLPRAPVRLWNRIVEGAG
jgi:hypothetical protein